MLDRTLNISTSPHVSKGISTDEIMRNVVWALIPVAIFAVYSFGLGALLVLVTAVLSAVLTEHFLCKWSNKDTTVSDWSAVITGLLLGLTLPPSFPIWMTFCGGVIAIALGKFAFGGLGYNVFNPALVGRAVLQASFPVAITTWYPAFLPERFSAVSSSVLTFPFMEPVVNGVTGATPLAAFKFDQVTAETGDLALGLITGSTGETCAVLILLGGAYLVLRKMMDWRIPVSILSTVFILSGILYLINSEVYPSPVFMIFSGGLMLGAVFMASDMVASPVTPLGTFLYGILIGLIVVVIRIWGGMPEGVMYAILLGNAVSPQIDKLIQPRVYGTAKKIEIVMNQKDQTYTAPPASSMKMLRAMVGIGIMCALLIVLTFEGTLPRIEKLKAAALEKAIFKVLPGATTKVAYQLGEDNKFTLSGGDDTDGQLVYAGYDEAGKLAGVVVEASGMGYADVIRILYGYDPEKQIIVGFYVLESKETPGLGDKIEKDVNFLANFTALDVSLKDDLSSLNNAVVTVKNGEKENPWEVDGITGATISSRAIGDALRTSTGVWVPLIFNNREAFGQEKNKIETDLNE